jgi:type IV pilus biogenesis protein PilP
MSRPARLVLLALEGFIACRLTVAAPQAQAQTIADYSRAQRAWLESTMSQAAAHSAGLGASAPTAPPPVGMTAAGASAPRRSTAPALPALQVSGVFATAGGAVVEVMVNATVYLLGAGQAVPGTPWRVESVAVDKVVLGHAAGVASSDTRSVRKVFWLPALY